MNLDMINMNEELSVEIARVQAMKDSPMRNERLHRLYASFHRNIAIEQVTLATSHILEYETDYDSALQVLITCVDSLNKARENEEIAEQFAEQQRNNQ